MLTRRRFGASLASAAFGGLALAGCSFLKYAREIPGYRTAAMPAVDRFGGLREDPNGLLDLPPGFEYRIVSAFGDGMDDGLVVPDAADGMGAFALDRDRVVLVRNHELDPSSRKGAVRTSDRRSEFFAHAPDGRPLPGGTTTIVYDCARHRVEAQFLSLGGTERNCAGGTTPWGSWLTCEESVSDGHGWVFEVPATGSARLSEARPLTGLGRFRHEAAAVDPATGIVYLTEDQPDGLFYRFLPDVPGALARGGRLEALAFADPDVRATTRNWSAPYWDGAPRQVRWVGIGDPSNAEGRMQAEARRAGAVIFARGEGIHFGDREIFFCCTGGGPIKSGQVMRYRPSPEEGRGAAAEARAPGSLEIFLESTDPRWLNYCDNLVVAPSGDIVLCEDAYVGGSGNYMARVLGEAVGDVGGSYLRGITPAGVIYNIARLREATELAGACFSPRGDILFVNVYSPARTLAITGPFDRPRPGWRLPPA